MSLTIKAAAAFLLGAPVLLASACGGGSTADEDMIISIPDIVGKRRPEVDRDIGKNDRCEEVKQGLKCYYRDGKIEIVYINGKADWFTVHDDFNVGGAYQLRRVGLSGGRPDFKSAHMARWNNHDGMREIMLFQNYVYVKARTL